MGGLNEECGETLSNLVQRICPQTFLLFAFISKEQGRFWSAIFGPVDDESQTNFHLFFQRGCVPGGGGGQEHRLKPSVTQFLIVIRGRWKQKLKWRICLCVGNIDFPRILLWFIWFMIMYGRIEEEYILQSHVPFFMFFAANISKNQFRAFVYRKMTLLSFLAILSNLAN